MKLIDLYVKIANGEMPEKIIFNNELYILKKWENIKETDYYCESTGNLLGDIYLTSLNDEVQILEDTPKEDKKIEPITDEVWKVLKTDLINKINEIIDYINKEK